MSRLTHRLILASACLVVLGSATSLHAQAVSLNPTNLNNFGNLEPKSLSSVASPSLGCGGAITKGACSVPCTMTEGPVSSHSRRLRRPRNVHHPSDEVQYAT